jgi:hypothetical protein
MGVLTQTVQKAPVRCIVRVKVFAFKVSCIHKARSVWVGRTPVFHPGFIFDKYFLVTRTTRLVINMPLAHQTTNPLLHIERNFNWLWKDFCVAKILLRDKSNIFGIFVAHVM